MFSFQKIILIYLLIINLSGFALMGIDKRKAIKNQWRIPEKRLFLISLLGGSIGTWSGMYVFHHKTRHWYFVIGMPAILFLQVGLCLYFAFIHR
ncbi:MAG: DUF1294 domain-containing protein [Lachnospiraceae bacterium]|nr:DUF1294 domain-containing protein [Lachnospiraceae bacterium]